jgi:RNA polymerase sigma-70 factor (ECF subfamily)
MVERPPRTDRVRTWLFEVAMNVARGSGRTRSRRLRLLNGEPPATFVSAAPVDAHTQLEVTERRQILLMKAEGFSLQEIAQVIGTSPGSVGTLAARALARLARELRLDDEGEWR